MDGGLAIADFMRVGSNADADCGTYSDSDGAANRDSDGTADSTADCSADERPDIAADGITDPHTDCCSDAGMHPWQVQYNGHGPSCAGLRFVPTLPCRQIQ